MIGLLQGAAEHEIEREVDGFLRGVAVARVTDNQDKDGLGRVRVRFPWQEKSGQSFWARLAVPMTGDDFGTYLLPEIGDEVLVAFDRGEQEHAYVLGSLWNGKAKPPDTNADGKNDRRLVRTRSKHELRFDDSDAAPEIELKLNDGKHLVLDKAGIKLEDQSGNKLVIESQSGAITIESKGRLNIKSQQVSIEAGAMMEIKAGGTLTIKGALVQIN